MPTAFRRLAGSCLALLVALGGPALAQTPVRVPAPVAASPLIAGTTFDPAVPTVRAVLGYDSGDWITRPSDVRRYFEALAAGSPDRMVIGEYGRTHEGRPLWWAAVGSARNIARLDQIKANARALADPRVTSPAQAQGLIADQPVLVWMAYSVHGDEISPADAAMAAAHHLLASRDPAVQAWLANTVVVVVPTQNPDGRDRFLNSFYGGFGTTPNPDALSAERDQPWPGGRYNHDLFDLNRDWFIQTQPETQGHAALVLDWQPQVMVDSHEMGTDASFFFPPEAQPLNPLIFPATLESRELIGRNTARRFDAAGVDYFNRQVYDAFYPGYGDGWPAYLGVVSMTYEQGSARGLAARRSSGEILTYRDTVRHHLIASLSTIEAASANHDRLLNNAYAFGRDGVEGGRGAFILSANPSDPGTVDRLAGLLTRSGLEVGQAGAAFTACGQSYAAGSYVVNLGQPRRRMAEVLLSKDVPLSADFLAEQERRRARGLGDQIYDVTAWSLPLMFNVPSARCASAPSIATTPAGRDLVRPAAIAGPSAAFGYLVEPGSAGLKLMVAAVRQGITLRSMEHGFTKDGRRWPSGTMVIPRAGNPADLTETLTTLAATTGARITGVADSWVSDGPGFGSSDAVLVRAPRVALAWDDPTDPSAAGAARYIVEREFGYPVTAIRTANLSSADLSAFQVLILPSGGGYADTLGEDGVTALRAWVERGGTLISLGRATRLLTAEDSKMLASRRQDAAGEEAADDEADATVIADASDYHALILAGGGPPDSVAGALLRAEVDPEHWLSVGMASSVNVLVQGGDIYSPLTRGQGTNVVRFSGPDDLVQSGQIWEQNRRQLAFKPFVMSESLGSGQLVAFTQDPTVRGYLEGLKPLLINAIFLGPAHSSPRW
ncbi:zinc carboxypeptidase [Brevundimonas sp. AJA228-03]|uniref:M14 family zinc carboxypeptidase n=1 Tax=Brevundimonas sp. AJA228-03 TaxID=2752515 RepID=UPI001AE0E614|nr:M14 family zinc carboxypeptidase [Brevundimonas sp. AJA228-03]QTN19363.1 zinc carboxypeptidase [Brevundimonas sp. AJA228-03]